MPKLAANKIQDEKGAEIDPTTLDLDNQAILDRLNDDSPKPNPEQPLKPLVLSKIVVVKGKNGEIRGFKSYYIPT